MVRDICYANAQQYLALPGVGRAGGGKSRPR